MSTISQDRLIDLPQSIRIITLNCWGLKYISKERHARLVEIGHQLASASPQPQIVGLQECWTQEDYLAIRKLTQHILPYGKFYHSGFFGAGLAILSAWPIVESNMYAYPLNGRPAAFYRGDWFVGKGIASARVRIGREEKDIMEVFCTHLHAPYEPGYKDSYACHRAAQAWEIAKQMRHAAERGHVVIGLGDFNMLRHSVPYKIISSQSPVRDTWPASTSAKQKLPATPSVDEAITRYGATCDSALNTWRWSKQMQKELSKGRDSDIDLNIPDPLAKRLDYIFFASNKDTWSVADVKVGMMMRHPALKVSLSDHFSVEATISRCSSTTVQKPSAITLSSKDYDEILDMIGAYMLRERRQRKWRVLHFQVQIVITASCLIAVWWSPSNYVSFVLMLVSSLGVTVGVLDGLMGFLFVKQEIRALKEFQWEVDNARKLTLQSVH